MPNHLATEVQDIGFPVGLTVDQSFEDGSIVLGEVPGLGVEVDEAAVDAVAAMAGWAAPSSPHVRPPSAGRRLVGQFRRAPAPGHLS